MSLQHDSLVALVTKVGAAHYVPIAVLVVAVMVFWQLDTYFGTFSFFLPILIAGGLWLISQGNRDKADHHALESCARSNRPKNGEWAGDGLVRLAGFPDLIHLEKGILPAGVHSRSDQQAQLNPQYLPRFVSRAFMVANTRGKIEAYIKYYKVNEETTRAKLKSWVLHPDQQVCVFGIWNDGELLPSLNRPRGLPVYAGSSEEVLARLKDDSSAFYILGSSLIFTAAGWMLFTYFW